MPAQDDVAALRALLEELGGELASGSLGDVHSKGRADLVTSLDERIESELRRRLPLLRAGSVVVGEELGGDPAELTWWVDPLDGTTNRVHGWPRSAVSVALYQGERPLLAVVRDPYLQETFWAVNGQGAWCGDRPLRVSRCRAMEAALLCTGFAPEPAAQWEVCRTLQRRSRGIRVSGCASLDLAYVAAGRVDAFWEIDLKPWDVAAGLLLVKEAGGLVGDLQGRPAGLATRNFLACGPEMLGLLLEPLARLEP
jgi:myo-inositol-1(or 4)-monophosphatase